jgi:hypothetical protein
MRWLATIHYRSELGVLDVGHAIEELEELHDLVEAGPDWNTIEKIELKLIRNLDPGLTIEQAEKQ